MSPGEPLMSVRGIGRTFRQRGGARVALSGVSFDLHENQTLAVIGESGAGKSTLSRIVAGLDRPSEGEVLVGGLPPRVRGGVVSPVQMVFQEPKEALNPFLSIGRSIAEPMRDLTRLDRRTRVAQLLEEVGLDPDRADHRPFNFSGGQLQRAVIARALAGSPRVLVCDEPTSALDVSVQAQILNLLMRLQGEHGFGCILITHDLSIARVLADDVLVLHQGAVVEQSAASDFFAAPAHEYSRRLLAAVSRQALHRNTLVEGSGPPAGTDRATVSTNGQR